MNKISVVLITMNEERNIGRCLDSVMPIADEVVVVDSLSTDATEEICARYHVRFVSHAWEGYTGSKNFADSLASHDLILSIDGDEVLSETLIESIKALKESEIADNEVFAMKRLNNYCGRWIKGCGLYPDTKVRIWRKGFAHWEGLIHEWLVYEKKPKVTLLNGDLLHYSWATPEDFRKQYFHFARPVQKPARIRGMKHIKNVRIGLRSSMKAPNGEEPKHWIKLVSPKSAPRKAPATGPKAIAPSATGIISSEISIVPKWR